MQVKLACPLFPQTATKTVPADQVHKPIFSPQQASIAQPSRTFLDFEDGISLIYTENCVINLHVL